MNKYFKSFSQSFIEATKESPCHIIFVYECGFKIVEFSFDINRIYYHGENGKKMYFDPIVTLHSFDTNYDF